MEALGMFKRGCILLLLFVGLIIPVVAGDVATYVNLGFSVNSRYFLFGYYGIDDENIKSLCQYVSGRRICQ